MLEAVPPEEEYSDYELYKSEYVKQHPKTNKNEANPIMKNANIEKFQNRDKTKKTHS